MPKHAILVTYTDMTVSILTEFVAKATQKYGANFSQLDFDSGSLATDLTNAVNAVPADDKLKIYISGHGGTGIDYIMNNGENKKQTVTDLAKLLGTALQARATAQNKSADTEINMISCLFGRTPDGSADKSPAAKLHRELFKLRVYVDLVARTESIWNTDTGRKTIPPSDHAYAEANDQARFFKAKANYTKIRCTIVGGAPVVQLRAYKYGDDVYIQSDTTAAKRALWADHTVDALMKCIKPTKKDNKIEIKDAREQVLNDTIDNYYVKRNAEAFKQALAKLVDATGNTVETNFTIHRDTLSKVNFWSLPKKAQVIRDLLAKYPR